MVRIPLSPSNTRSAGNGPMSGGSTPRHLFRLGLLLVLILLMMRGARRTEVYEPFFGAPSGNEVDLVASRIISSDLTSEFVQSGDASSPEIAPASVRAEASNPPVIVSNVPPRVGPTVAEAVVDDAVADLSPQQQIELLARLFGDHSDRPTEVWETDSAVRSAVIARLYANAFSRVVDGSVYRSGDRAAFEFLLRMASANWKQFSPNQSINDSAGPTSAGPTSAGSTSASRITAVPLLQQPGVYRGKFVRVDGQLARIDSVPVRDSPFGIDSYYQLWLRPTGGANRPVIVATPDVPPGIKSLTVGQNLSNGPMVSVVGVYFKRLAYRSGVGADLAPVIIAPVQQKVPIASTADPAAGATQQSLRQLWWLFPIATVLGIAIAATVMVSSRRSSRRLSEIRRIGPLESTHFENL